MDHSSNKPLQQFREKVGIKFQLYNSLFTSLPFHRIEKTGILLSLLSNNCEEGYKLNLSPVQIIDDFFERHTTYRKEEDRNDLLFRFVQYVERQVVLFDALEDSAFRHVHDLNGVGTLKHLESEVIQENKGELLALKLKEFGIRLVLTAHPTQFYPGPVLGIIHDLSNALGENNTGLVNTYLQQLGKTPFFKKKKPTPYDEAVSLIWYLENVFYSAIGRIISSMKTQFPEAMQDHHPIISMGFWPGGDKDGNPHATSEIMLQVAEGLRGAIIKCYYMDVRRLKRRLTFQGVDILLAELESNLYGNLFIPGARTSLSTEELLATLHKIRDIIIHQHNGLFQHLVDNLINRVEAFGLHFASLDVRQDSTVHTELFGALAHMNVLPSGYAGLPEPEKIRALSDLSPVEIQSLADPFHRDTIQTIAAIRKIQEFNGAAGCHRYVISQCHSALNVMEVYGLFLLAGWTKQEINIDIVPLFETVDDLGKAALVMRTLYEDPVYQEHLKKRGSRQTIMLGFSDGTKDGGYLMANWGIYKAKEELTAISREHGIEVIFFDGRGGPPARGGGKTHKFYASMGPEISNKEIQLTIQGQTVSSNFGTADAAQYNIEQLLNAGISNNIFSDRESTFRQDEKELLQQLAASGYEAYRKLRDHPYLTDYLLQVSPVLFYSETNIASRPSKRGSSHGLSLKSLRAIPFAGAWSQLKQNVTGYYGVGSALRSLEKQGKFGSLQKLYKESMFFKTLMDNCEMAMLKSFFPLTSFLSKHEKYGELWQLIYEEYELTREYIFRLSGKTELMADYPVDQLSILMRERIVLPLATIQQYALTRIRELDEALVQAPVRSIYEKLAMRCSFGIINAGRNSA